MIEPERPADEPARQAAVDRYEILDTLPERAYDDLTALMASLCDVPIALIGLIDRERHWLKSHHGVPMSESPRAISFCGHAINAREELFVVEDAREDPRFADNPIVLEHGVLSYAGAPLIDEHGFALGTLCVFDVRPRRWTEEQRAALVNMARNVVYLMERHLRERRLERAAVDLSQRNEDLQHFAGVVSHDILGPVNTITSFLELLGDDANDERLRTDLRMLHRSSRSLHDYVDGLSRHYLAESLTEHPTATFEVAGLFDALDALLARDPERTTIVFDETRAVVHTFQAALQQVLLNLASNAIKYGNDGRTRIEIGFAETDHHYRFTVTDDGPGIEKDRQDRIFELFETGEPGRDGRRGTGIGLATVRRLLDRLGGGLSLDSAPGEGCRFTVELPKPSVSARAA